MTCHWFALMMIMLSIYYIAFDKTKFHEKQSEKLHTNANSQPWDHKGQQNSSYASIHFKLLHVNVHTVQIMKYTYRKRLAVEFITESPSVCVSFRQNRVLWKIIWKSFIQMPVPSLWRPVYISKLFKYVQSLFKYTHTKKRLTLKVVKRQIHIPKTASTQICQWVSVCRLQTKQSSMKNNLDSGKVSYKFPALGP